jgi:2-polyprenyl-3-methyl-5-hydroxy-6-metoxy-1,4-benzoquinol methylase
MTSNANCPLCGKSTYSVLANQLRRGNGKVCYCGLCQHGFLVQQSVVDAKKYYAELYRQEYSHNADVTATNANELFDVYHNFQHDRLKSIEPFLRLNMRLLEVGASAGQFLVHIKDKVAKVNAIELDEACCEFLQRVHGFDADAEHLEKSRFAGERYDIVCAFQVMEHVDDPVTFLKTLKEATCPGGTLFIEVPNLRDPLLSIWDVPTYRNFFYHTAHLHYFTESSLRLVALRAGFAADQVGISYTQDYNLLNHLHWIMNDGPQANCLIGLSEIELPGVDKELSAWLTQEMKSLNERYIARLVVKKSCSNMMMTLRNE